MTHIFCLLILLTANRGASVDPGPSAGWRIEAHPLCLCLHIAWRRLCSMRSRSGCRGLQQDDRQAPSKCFCAARCATMTAWQWCKARAICVVTGSSTHVREMDDLPQRRRCHAGVAAGARGLWECAAPDAHCAFLPGACSPGSFMQYGCALFITILMRDIILGRGLRPHLDTQSFAKAYQT